MTLSSRLFASERGAVYVFGLFGTFFLAGLVYGTLGLGRALLESSYASDRVDAAALVGSLVLARGMNLLVYINLLMAGLLAVLIGLRLAQTLLTIGAVTLFGLAWPTYGATLPFAGLATDYASEVGDLYEEAKDVVYPILEGLHEVEEAISVLLPPLAVAEVAREGLSGDGREVLAASLPSSIALPVEWDTFSRLCEKGARLGAELALLPVTSLGGGATGFLEPLISAAGAMGAALSDYLCGEGEGQPPRYEETIERTYPRSALAKNCEDTSDASTCDEAKRELERARYDETTGECSASSDCAKGGAFDRMVALARHQCSPDSGLKPRKWLYQERLVEVSLEATSSGALGWKPSRTKPLASSFETSEQPPCGPEGWLGRRYEVELYESSTTKAEPVCRAGDSNAFPFGMIEPPRVRGENRKLVRRVVAQILGCVVDEKKSTPLAEEGESIEGDEEKSPAKLEDDLDLGTEAFQLRVLGALETPPDEDSERVFDLLRKDRVPGERDPISETWKRLPSLYAAQSEYYFDHPGDVPREEWLWQPRWTARLVRIRLPNEEESQREDERREARRSSDESLLEEFGLETPSSESVQASEFPSLETLLVH